MTTEAVDEARAQAFALQMVGVMNHAMLGLMTSIGHRTELFDTMAGLPPSTDARESGEYSVAGRKIEPGGENANVVRTGRRRTDYT